MSADIAGQVVQYDNPHMQQSVTTRVGTRFGVNPNNLLAALRATAFKADREVSNEEMVQLLVVADQYKLNPFTRELYAFVGQRGVVVPIVSVDGWSRIINEHPQFDGVEFSYDNEWVECSIYRKDRSHPATVREFMAECVRTTGPWKSHPKRMLRHKALIQCARIAFGFAGIFDEDEGARIIEAEIAPKVIGATTGARDRVTPERLDELKQVAEVIRERMAADDIDGAYEAQIEVTDADETVALWSFFGPSDSKIRSALKAHAKTVRDKDRELAQKAAIEKAKDSA